MPLSTIVQRLDVGVQFVIQVRDEFTNNVVDISRATNLLVTFQRPDKTLLIVPGTLLTDGTDGQVYYTSVTNDLSLSGIWYIQLSYNLGPNFKKTSIETFTVSSNLGDT